MIAEFKITLEHLNSLENKWKKGISLLEALLVWSRRKQLPKNIFPKSLITIYLSIQTFKKVSHKLIGKFRPLTDGLKL